MPRAAPAPLVAGLLVALVGWSLTPATQAEPGPDAAWWTARVPITLVLTGGEDGALQGPDGRGGVLPVAALLDRLRRRARDGGGVLAPLALGWHVRGVNAGRDETDGAHWRALFEAGGYVGSLMGGPECSAPVMGQSLGGMGELGTPRRPLNVLLAPRHLASESSAFFDTRLGGASVRALTVLDDEDATRLRDRGEALAQIAVATAFQNLPPMPNHLWVVATWPRAETTLASLSGAMSRLGPAVLVDVSGEDGVAAAKDVVLGAGRPPLIVALGRRGSGIGVLDLVPDATGEVWRASYRRIPVAAAPSPEGAGAARADGVLAQRALALRTTGFLAQVPLRDDVGARFVGSTACLTCHTAIYKSWKGSPHAGALLRLRDTHAAWDPNCVSCHVVGWSRSPGGGAWARHTSGFRDPVSTGYLGGVGCESCHGPGSRHLMDPWNPALFESGGPNRRGAEQSACAHCHDETHHPDFAGGFPTHLAAVGHVAVPPQWRTVVPERLLERLRRAGLAPR